jgi:hypothetical protein
VALEDLRDGLHRLFEAAQAFLVMAFHHHFDEDRIGRAELRLVEDRSIAANDPRLLQPLYPRPPW